MKTRVLSSILAGVAGIAAGCSDDGGALFTAKPECKGAAVTPLAGTFPQVISTLAIGMAGDGFDLDGDGKVDNKLAGVSSVAGTAITDALNRYDLLLPLEMFDFPKVAADTCVKFAMYIGKYGTDADGDGKQAYLPGGDCNDHVAAVKPGATEIVGDGIDNDCDGLAEESASNTPSQSAADDDQDGQTIAQGDCDDHNSMVKLGLAEICGDGLDNDCDGVADRTEDAEGAPTACSPFDPSAPRELTLDPVSLASDVSPLVAFKDGTVDSAKKLHAGPSLFQISIPIIDISLDLNLTGTTIEATVQPDGTLTNGRIGGVIDAKSADKIRGIEISQLGLKPENSLLDAVFANSLGLILALPLAKGRINEMYPDCRVPDIDVDGDGLEAFCSSDPSSKIVDVCIDGDGTVIKDTATTECTEALKGGKPRFVDGISVLLKFSTAPLAALKPAP